MIAWRRKWQPTPAFLPEEFHGSRSLTGFSPWGPEESDKENLSLCSLPTSAELSPSSLVMPGWWPWACSELRWLWRPRTCPPHCLFASCVWFNFKLHRWLNMIKPSFSGILPISVLLHRDIICMLLIEEDIFSCLNLVLTIFKILPFPLNKKSA